jgi:small subunit ribosomal protein S1
LEDEGAAATSGLSEVEQKKQRTVFLSNLDFEVDEAEIQETLAEYNSRSAEASSGTTKLGALLREQLGKGE